MATQTPNYNQVKPAPTDNVNIADLNGNADIIDAQMKANADKISSYIIVEETTGTGSINSGVGNFTFPITSHQGYAPIMAIWENCGYSGSFCPHETSKVLSPTDTSFTLSAWSSNAYTSPSTTAKAYVLYAKA